MRTITAVSLWIVRVAGTVQLVLGILFWTGHGYRYLPLHIVSGVVIVLTLWTVAVLALVARTRPGLATFGLIWGLALPAFGIRQAMILVGPMHWIVRVVHLLMGLAAMGVAGALGQAMLAAAPGVVRPSDGERRVVVPSRVS
jgi:hypothetical protein